LWADEMLHRHAGTACTSLLYSGQEVSVLTDTTKRPYSAYLVRDSAMLGKVTIAAPIFRDVWFIRDGKGLYCKRFVRTSCLMKVADGPAGEATWKSDTQVFTLSLGELEVLSVTDLGQHGLLLSCSGKNGKEWLLLDPQKMVEAKKSDSSPQ